MKLPARIRIDAVSGEIYLAEHPAGQKHPFLIVSRDELNRGKRVIGVNITSVDVERRSAYPNCIPIAAGQLGLSKDSVIQCENVVAYWIGVAGGNADR